MLPLILHIVACTGCGAATTRPFKSFGPFFAMDGIEPDGRRRVTAQFRAQALTLQNKYDRCFQIVVLSAANPI